MKRNEKDPAAWSPSADLRGQIFTARGALPVADTLEMRPSFHVAAGARKNEHRRQRSVGKSAYETFTVGD